MLPVIEIVLGGALLLFGRRLYWLLAATMGFVAGLYLADLFLPNEPQSTGLIIAAALAFGGAILMVLFQKALIAVVGFLAGGIGLYLLMTSLTTNLITETWMAASVFLVGGAIGAVLLHRLFDLGLIILSAVIGAYVTVAGLGTLLTLTGGAYSISLVLLIIVGIVVQLGLFRRR